MDSVKERGSAAKIWTKIIIVRHGQTAYNTEKRIMGWLDKELNAVGKKQAELLGKRLRTWKIDHFFTSPLSRARQTCEAITQHHNAQAQIIEDFGEINITLWEGMSWSEVANRYPRKWEIWRSNPASLNNVQGLESLVQVRKRVGVALDQIIKEQRGKTILITAHDAVTRLALFHLLGLDNKHYRRFPVDNTGVSIVRVSDSKAELLLFNDVSHIGD